MDERRPLNRFPAMNTPTASPLRSYAFVLKLTDHPGGMEVIAATFAHRGVSLSCSLGNDGALDPEGRATVLVTFAAPPAKKEIIRRALARLSRVRSLVEHPMDSPDLRKTAMFRVTDLPGGSEAEVGKLERIFHDETTGETTYLLVDTPNAVDTYLARIRASGRLRDVTTTVIGL